MKKFFVIVPPGFEQLAVRELELRGYPPPLPESVIRGGFELELPIEDGYRLNYDSHIATRVLERLAKWRCRDFPKLFNKTQSIEWEKWIAGPIEVEVSAHKSRLMNKKRIAETVAKGIQARLKKHPSRLLKKKTTTSVSVFVRFSNDEVEMSLDTSGDALFKRGYKTLADAAAPIRENLAAAVFWAIYEHAGRPKEFTLIDPTCGTATLLTEAASFFRPKPPRDYAFELWAAKLSKNPSQLPGAQVSLIGFDRDSDTLEKAKLNSKNLGVELRVKQADFLKPESFDLTDSLRIGIANPPYGERIKWPVPPKQFYAGLIDFYKKTNCKLYGFIVPRQKVRELPQAHQKIDFENGGIPVSLLIYGSI